MSETRELAHQLIDRMAETQLSGLVHFLETIVHPATSALRDAALDDEAETDEDETGVEQARVWLKANGGRGIPHAEAMRRLGLE